MAKKLAVVSKKECVACGVCVKQCPRNAITIDRGLYAVVNEDLCVGCTLCAKACTASIIHMEERG